MASNPPFSVEDNTDEDFFDKLVDDDDDVDFKVSTSAESGGRHVVSDGNESDEAKAFANLSINELDDHGEVNVEQVSSSDRSVVDDLSAKVETAEQISKVETGERHGIPLVSADSFEFGTVLQKLENENGGANVLVNADSGEAENVGVSDMPVLSKTTSGSEIGARGVKEVAWSAFNEESVQNDSNGFGSYSDFFTEFGGENPSEAFNNTVGVTSKNGLQDAVGNDVHGSTYMDTADNYGQYNHTQNDSIAADQSSSVQDMSSTQYWENQYPGWQYDYGTGQWYQVDGYDGGSTVEGNADSNVTSTWGGAGGQVDLSYMQQTGHSVSGAVAEAGKTETVSNWNQTSLASDATETTNWNQVSEVSGNSSVVSSDWNQASNDNNGYPAHMVFDPQYPGWYYDTIAQEWRALESYAQSEQSTAQVHDKMSKDDYSFTDTFSQNNTLTASSSHDQGNNYNPQIFGSQSPDQNWLGSANNYNQQNSRMWLPDKTGTAGEAGLQYTENQVTENNYAQNVSASLHGSQQSNAHYAVNGPYYENLSQHQNNNYSMPSQFVGGNFSQHFNDSKVNQNDQKYFSNDFYGNQNAVNFSQQQIQNTPMTYNPALGRSSAGRPAHALVAFGFGGKLVVMNHNNSNENLNYGSQNPVGGSITVLNLSEVVTGNIDAVNHGSTYFQALCQHSLPGPLTGGSVATKELNKWIEERLNSEPAHMDYRKAEVLKLLLSLLKIACQYYGKLRSPYGTDAAMKESDAPESAVAKLFAFAKRNGSQFNQYGDITRCLQQLPSEGQLQATAAEVQNLLVSGRKKEALECAQEGQLWGPALVLAAQLGDQFYVDTVKQMALRQLVAGSPLRTLCLLIAGQPADVFSADTAAVNNMTGSINVPQQPAQFGANCMLDDWEENLAVITANRTKDDELVLIHLGDCLWKERSDIIAAHICYLVAESSFEPYSDSARLCLIGANHLKMPRTYASPEAIQRTEIYEYSKTLGNSQSVLLSFQPYKYVYALMLAEVGRTSEALKYCQAVLKSLKTGRTHELENLRNLVSSLEDRIKAHQQGGFSVNLAPKEFIGKLLNLFDSTAHRVVGGLPPPAPTSGGAVYGNENHYQSSGPRVSSSQSTMAMSSLVPQSMEPINEWAADNKKIMHTRSVSEPDFGRSPMQSQADPSKEATSASTQDKASAGGGTSRLGRFSFGSQLFQKTVGLVLNRQGRQAKLGETNKFYYDEKLKRWVEEGVDPPAPEAALPPPPKASVFQNGASEMNSLQSEPRNNGNLEFKSPSTMDNSPGMPPLPPTANQYSARGRMGVRSRYVDTFNRGGGNTVSGFQSPFVPSAKPAGGINPKFFVPAPVSHAEQLVVEEKQNASTTYENPSSSPPNDSFHSPTPSSSMAAMQRFGSMSNIYNKGANDSSFALHSRRTASWGGSLNDSMSPPNRGQPPGEPLGMRPPSFRQSDTSLADSSVSGGSFGEELQEVEL
ncbi:protein transport protein SEC16B homolog [Salvia splendens]|uniref:protein transport protein SEC16B homolog n=1 Tax=Salvia splendens TaxID=180675 RepID=UPI001C25942B|nr:protein transport protein SEC16B homolog [Salvia splendens]